MAIPEDFSKEELLRRIEGRWTKLQDLLGALTPAEWEEPLGDGWPVKVHVDHLAAWERSALAILERGSRAERMGVPNDIWEGHDTDAINEHLANKAMDLPAVMCREQLDDSHEKLVAKLESLSEDDLLKPYSHFQPDAAEVSNPVLGWVVGNTFGHYDEHIEWLEKGLTAEPAV